MWSAAEDSISGTCLKINRKLILKSYYEEYNMYGDVFMHNLFSSFFAFRENREKTIFILLS